MRIWTGALFTIAVFLALGKTSSGQEFPLSTDTLRIVNKSVVAGDTGVRIDIALRNTRGAGGVGIRFLYDPSVFTPRTPVVAEETPRDAGFSWFVFGGSVPTPGVVNFTAVVDFFGDTGAVPIAPGTGPVFRIVFDVSASAAAGNYTLTIQDDPSAPGAFNRYTTANGDSLFAPVKANGTVTVTGGGPITPQNDPPIIASIPMQSVTELDTLTFSVSAFDPEGDNVTLSGTSLPANATFSTVVGDSVVNGVFTFVPGINQGPDTVTATFRAVDDSGLFSQRSVAIEIIDRPQDILSIDSTAGGIPGKTSVLVPIILNNIQDIFGVQFDLEYNSSLITIDSFVADTIRLANFVFFTNLGDSTGLVRLLAFSLSRDSIPPGTGPILYIAVTIDSAAPPGHTFLDLKNGVESISRNPGDPSVTLTTVGGNFTVDAFGDLNLDLAINVQDAVIMVGYLLGDFVFNPRRLDVADVNADSSIDIGDLVGIINLILGRPIGAPTFYVAGTACVELSHDDFSPGALQDVDLAGSFQVPVAGAQVTIDYDPRQLRFNQLVKTSRSNQMTLSYKDNYLGRLVLIMYRASGGPIDVGQGSILTLRTLVSPYLDPGESVKLKISKLVLSDTAAVVIGAGGTPPVLPTDFKLQQNFPNPFNANTTIRFEVPGSASALSVRTVLTIYDILGRKVRVLVDDERAAGRYQVIWDGRNESGDAVASGVYFYRLRAGETIESKKMTLIK